MHCGLCAKMKVKYHVRQEISQCSLPCVQTTVSALTSSSTEYDVSGKHKELIISKTKLDIDYIAGFNCPLKQIHDHFIGSVYFNDNCGFIVVYYSFQRGVPTSMFFCFSVPVAVCYSCS